MRRIILLLAATLLVGCGDVHSPHEITGSYVGVLPHVTVFLVLRSDHTYSERLDYFDGKQEAVSGTWFWGVPGVDCVELYNALYPNEAVYGGPRTSSKTNWCIGAERWWSGKTTFSLNPGMGWYFEPEEPGVRDRQDRYQAALSSYSAALKPGMTREIVEHYLQAKNTGFIQTDCVDPKPPPNCGRADLVKIGEEDAPWVYKRQNIYIAFQFTGQKRPNSTWTDDAWDTLESITIFRRYEARF
jgi:hypothetical protein